jgi:hypothetical protein
MQSVRSEGQCTGRLMSTTLFSPASALTVKPWSQETADADRSHLGCAVLVVPCSVRVRIPTRARSVALSMAASPPCLAGATSQISKCTTDMTPCVLWHPGTQSSR